MLAYPCLQAINWLREQWSEGNNAVLADEQGLGKSASVLAFLQSLRADFACPGPVLLVAPAASLPFWEGALHAAWPLVMLPLACCCGSCGAGPVTWHCFHSQPNTLMLTSTHCPSLLLCPASLCRRVCILAGVWRGCAALLRPRGCPGRHA